MINSVLSQKFLSFHPKSVENSNHKSKTIYTKMNNPPLKYVNAASF